MALLSTLVQCCALQLPTAGDIEQAAPAPAGPAFPPVAARLPEDYVETLMVEKRESEDDDFRASYLVALGLRSPVPLEQVVALGARTLIEGLPGAGKSTL